MIVETPSGVYGNRPTRTDETGQKGTNVMLTMRKNHPEYDLARKLYEKLVTLYANFDDLKINFEEGFYQFDYQGNEKPYDYNCSEYQNIKEDNIICIWIKCCGYEVTLLREGYEEDHFVNPRISMRDAVELAPIFARFLELEEEAARLCEEFANLGLNIE